MQLTVVVPRAKFVVEAGTQALDLIPLGSEALSENVGLPYGMPPEVAVDKLFGHTTTGVLLTELLTMNEQLALFIA